MMSDADADASTRQSGNIYLGIYTKVMEKKGVV
jgi:hypothetical protein